MERIRELGSEYKINGKTMVLERHEMCKDGVRIRAIYVERGNDTNIEVQVLRLRNKHPKDEGMYDKIWLHPNNESWGKTGWSYRSIVNALIKYNSIE